MRSAQRHSQYKQNSANKKFGFKSRSNASAGCFALGGRRKPQTAAGPVHGRGDQRGIFSDIFRGPAGEKGRFSALDEVFTVFNACAILYGNPVKGPLKIKVFESERQITINGFPLFVWDGVTPDAGSFFSQLSTFVQTYRINHGDMEAQQQAAYEEQFKTIQENANSIQNYSDEAWEAFIRAELDKMDLPGKWIKVYPTQLFGLYNPCPNRQFPRLRVNYRLDSFETDYEFRSELHHSWDRIVDNVAN